MPQLRSLWVNERGTRLREAWMGRFASLCQIHEIGLSQLSTPEAKGEWDFVCFNFDYPEMTQLKLVPETKRRWPSAPILLLTLQCSTELAVWALRVRVFDLLVKPISPHEVEHCLQRVTQVVHARRSQSERRPQALSAEMPTEARYRPHVAPSLRLEQALAHIGRHYGQPMPESQMAHLCEMSPSRFCREFKAAYGVTYVEYLARYRVIQAKRLLENPTISVADVAATVGFADPSYFTRVFHRLTGLSPSAFRGRPVEPEHEPPLLKRTAGAAAG